MSLKINSLQESLWFRLGFACMYEERWSEAAEAYRRYCDLESDVSNKISNYCRHFNLN